MLEVTFVILDENPSDVTNNTQGTWKYQHQRKQLERQIFMWDMPMNQSQYFHLDGKASYLLLPSLVFLISDDTVKSENTYFFYSLQRGKCHPH